MKKNISIIGAGSFGTVLSVLLSKNGHFVRMWSFFEKEVHMLNTYREHKEKLPGIMIPLDVICSDNIEVVLENTDIILLVVPSQIVRQTAKMIARHVKSGTCIVCCAKGIEEQTGFRLSEVIEQEILQGKIVALSGPSHAEEVANDIPTTVVSASKDINAALFVQDIMMSSTFRVYTNEDIIGVELGGAVKNVIALCAGISDGLGFGDNTKAALMTRGMAEIIRLGVAMGANIQTFSGLSGIGDLIVTCTSMHSRNRRAGILIGQGKSVEEAINEVKMVVEGIVTAKAVYQLAKKHDVSMPITEQAYQILFNKKDARQAVMDLMMRDKKSE